MTDTVTTRQTTARAIAEPLGDAVRRNWRVQGAMLLASAIFLAIRLLWPPNGYEVLIQFWYQSIGAYVVASAIAALLFLVYSGVSSGSLYQGIAYLREQVLTRGNIATTLPAIVALGLVLNSFTDYKSNIAATNPYGIDAALTQLDRLVHFGYEPWRVLQAVLGHGPATYLLDKIYYQWFPVIFVSAAFFIWMPNRRQIRHQFLLTFVLVWCVLGVVCATAMSSVGPIFYDRVYGGPSSFTPLMNELLQTGKLWPLTTLQVSDVLWNAYAGGESTVVSGISAMPSVHNAMCVLIFLAARRIDWRLGVAAALFGLAIFIGSIHLGWHYAIDAYASVLGVAVLWKLSGRLTRQFDRAPSVSLHSPC